MISYMDSRVVLNRPNYDKAIQGQKNQVPQEKKSIKLEIQTFIQLYSSLPTNYVVKMGSSIYKGFQWSHKPTCGLDSLATWL